MYGDLLLDQLGVNFLGPAPLDLELLHMLTTFHWNALGSTLGWWFCHDNTVRCNKKFWVEQVAVPCPPLGKDKGWGRTRGGGGTGDTSGSASQHTDPLRRHSEPQRNLVVDQVTVPPHPPGEDKGGARVHQVSPSKRTLESKEMWCGWTNNHRKPIQRKKGTCIRSTNHTAGPLHQLGS